jgi:C4-dicarboxylate-specific signal transduction histidine kinase
MASLGHIAAGITHEINNPLSVIVGKAHKSLARDGIQKI